MIQMFSRDNQQHGLAVGISILFHLALLFFVFPVHELKVQSQTQLAVPVVLDFDKPVQPQAQQVESVGDPKSEPVAKDPGVPLTKVVEAPIQPPAIAKPVLPIGQPQPTSLPGDRTQATAVTPNMVVPTYPKEALNNRWEGTVVVEVDIDVAGKPKWVRVVKTSGYSILDDAFVRFVKNYYSFKPKRLLGKEMEDTLRLSYTFELDR